MKRWSLASVVVLLQACTSTSGVYDQNEFSKVSQTPYVPELFVELVGTQFAAAHSNDRTALAMTRFVEVKPVRTSVVQGAGGSVNAIFSGKTDLCDEGYALVQYSPGSPLKVTNLFPCGERFFLYKLEDGQVRVTGLGAGRSYYMTLDQASSRERKYLEKHAMKETTNPELNRMVATVAVDDPPPVITPPEPRPEPVRRWGEELPPAERVKLKSTTKVEADQEDDRYELPVPDRD